MLLLGTRECNGCPPASQATYALALKGKRTYLAWCRDSQNTWQSELVDGKQPETISGMSLDLADCGLDLSKASVRAYDPWQDKWSNAKVAGKQVTLPPFQRSVVLRVDAQ
jgi:hypothetical protein